MNLLTRRIDVLPWYLKLNWSLDLLAMGLLTLVLLDVVTPLTWSDIVLCEEEESGFPHEETCPVMFSRFYTSGPEKHPVTKMILKSLMRSRCPRAPKCLAVSVEGPAVFGKEVKLVLT